MAIAATIKRIVIRGWRLRSPPFPGTPRGPGRRSQMSATVDSTTPALTAIALKTSDRGRAAMNWLRLREGLIAASPLHHPSDHDCDLIEEVHGNSHEE